MAPTLSAQGKAKLDDILKQNVASGEIPAATFAVVTSDLKADPIYINTAGDRVYGDASKGQIDEDTVLQLMSMTKLVVTIAALQLLDAGKVSLDDPELITKHLPELVKLDILRAVTDGVPAYTKRTKPITLRHLLTHTSGLGYDIMVPMLGEWVAATGAPASFAKNPTVKSFEHPLLFEPGTAWNYSLGLDWAGVLVERITGQTLEQYFQDNIFKPVGAKTLTFTPTPVHYERLQAVTARTEDLKLVVFPGIRDTSPEAIVGQASGGAGLYGTARDYLRVLQGVLASAQPGGLVSPESYKLIFSDQLPKAGEDKFAGQLGFAQLIPHIHPSLVENKQIRHSLGGFLSTADSPVGRKAYSDWWEGIYKTFYWMDPTTGVAGVFTTQLFAFGVPNEKFDGVFNKLERALYNELK